MSATEAPSPGEGLPISELERWEEAVRVATVALQKARVMLILTQTKEAAQGLADAASDAEYEVELARDKAKQRVAVAEAAARTAEVANEKAAESTRLADEAARDADEAARDAEEAEKTARPSVSEASALGERLREVFAIVEEAKALDTPEAWTEAARKIDKDDG